MPSVHYEHEFPNGLRLLVEPIAGVRSAAYAMLLPAGVAFDPPDRLGTAQLLTSLAPRGAGANDSRALTIALDNLGVQRVESAEIYNSVFSGATIGGNLLKALELTFDIVRRPRMEPEQLEFCQLSTLQELEAIEDDTGQKHSIEMRRRALPAPLGQPVLGTPESVEAATIEGLEAWRQTHYRPNGAILGVAGAVDFDSVRDAVGRWTSDWAPADEIPLRLSTVAPGYDHLRVDKQQTQIGVAFPAVSVSDPDYYNAHGAIGVLSGGMSARLFTEVREKRGLCYSVSASFVPLRDRGVALCYAGTTNERASETLSVLLAELRRLSDGIGADEVRRVRAGLKSALIMQEESTAARASILVRNWFYLGRVRSLEEVAGEIDRLTPASILGYLERHPPKDFVIVTLGPQPLEATA